MSKVTPFLMFNDQLGAAMEFYTASAVRPSWATIGARTSPSPMRRSIVKRLRLGRLEVLPNNREYEIASCWWRSW